MSQTPSPHSSRKRWFGFSLGVAVAISAIAFAGHQALAQHQDPAAPQRPRILPAPADGNRFQPQPPRPGVQSGPALGAPGGFPVAPPPFPGPPMPGGGATMTATATTVYVLRGNTLYAFDANSLKLKAQKELPAPQPGSVPPQSGFGFGGQGGFGVGGYGGGGSN